MQLTAVHVVVAAASAGADGANNPIDTADRWGWGLMPRLAVISR